MSGQHKGKLFRQVKLSEHAQFKVIIEDKMMVDTWNMFNRSKSWTKLSLGLLSSHHKILSENKKEVRLRWMDREVNGPALRSDRLGLTGDHTLLLISKPFF